MTETGNGSGPKAAVFLYCAGSGIGPVLFLIDIDDLAKLLERNGFTVNLFTDDVKVYLEVVENADVIKLQGALDLMPVALHSGSCKYL